MRAKNAWPQLRPSASANNRRGFKMPVLHFLPVTRDEAKAVLDHQRVKVAQYQGDGIQDNWPKEWLGFAEERVKFWEDVVAKLPA